MCLEQEQQEHKPRSKNTNPEIKKKKKNQYSLSLRNGELFAKVAKGQFTRGLITAKEEDRSNHNNKGEIPKHVEDHHRLRVGPVALVLLKLLGRGLPNHHR